MSFRSINESIPSLELEKSTSLLLKDLIMGKNYPSINEAINSVKTIIACYYSSRENGISINLKNLNKNHNEIFKWA